jgi:hypothetical protein
MIGEQVAPESAGRLVWTWLERDVRRGGTGGKPVGQIEEDFDRFLQQRSASTRGMKDF